MLKPSLLVALAVASGSAWAQPPQSPPVASHMQLVVQPSAPMHAGGMRQLSPQERAELRRQLWQFHKSASKSP